MKINSIFLSKEKKRGLEKELKKLETAGRKELAEKLAEARALSWSDDDAELIMTIDEKNELEGRISEIRDLLFRAKVTKKECKTTADIGSEVIVANGKSIVVYKLVSSIEVDPEKYKISVDSKVGKKLQGLKAGDKVKLTNPDGVELEYTVLYIC